MDILFAKPLYGKRFEIIFGYSQTRHIDSFDGST